MSPELLPEFLVTLKGLPVDKLVKLFIKTRAARAAATKIYDASDAQFKKILEACENYMLAKADAEQVTGFTTPFGTTYTAETSKISIANDEDFFNFVMEKKDLDFFERRVSSTHVNNYIKANDGLAPPGLNIFRERVMRVRKAGEK